MWVDRCALGNNVREGICGHEDYVHGNQVGDECRRVAMCEKVGTGRAAV